MSISVLIADDHAVVRDDLRLLLENQSDIRVVGEVVEAARKVYKNCFSCHTVDKKLIGPGKA